MKISHRSAPFVLLIVCILAYGIYIFWMGFYWDDWPWVWFSHVMGPQGMLRIDLEHRPLSGVVLWIGSLLAGGSTVGWQIYNLIFRLFTGVSLWWMLQTLWPQRRDFAVAVSLLFLVYPGFGQQFVAVNNSRHLLPLAFFFLSVGWMVKAIQDRTHYWRDTIIALGLSLTGMLTTDYYYGLELIRPIILWFLIEPSKKGRRVQIILKNWIPYLISLVGIFIWRFWVSQQHFYQVSIFEESAGTEISLLTKFLDPIDVTLGAWAKIFEFPQTEIFGPRMMFLYMGIVITGILTLVVYLWFFQSDPVDYKWNLKPLALGVIAVIVAFLPFWATNLDVKLVFPNDRLTLPMMMGSSLILVSTIFFLVRNRGFRILLLAAIFGMSLGVHIQKANDYRRDWRYQKAFFEQLTWRVPWIEHSTAILANEFPYQTSTDNSLTAPLNWIFAPDFTGGNLPVMMFFTSRFGEDTSHLTSETPIQEIYRFYPFDGRVGQSIVVYHTPPACLRVLDPVYDLHFPLLQEDVKNLRHFSDPHRIVDADPSTSLPVHIFGPATTGSWCYYFEKADLARQLGDWAQVADLGDIAFSLDDSPNHASERVPFIEGYAHVGDWEKALNLTQEAIKINKFMGPMLCDTWQRIADDVAPSDKKAEAMFEIQQIIECNL
jgi:hypothetical protein